MNGEFDGPETEDDMAVVTGSAPVSEMQDYQREVTTYSRGRGKLFCTLKGYFPCHNQDEAEVTEVRDGIVEIKSIAREAGSRTKIAVWSNDPDVDPVGACVGMNGARVGAVVNELRGEKIDIINWSDNPAILIENALSPAKVISVMADPDERTASVIVPDYQLSLAIGKEGQNARLAARLTGSDNFYLFL